MIARTCWNRVTLGLASASFCWIGSALPYAASAPAGSPVAEQQNGNVVVASCQVVLELREAGVGLGQLLPDRQRLAVFRPCAGHVTRIR